MAAPGKWKNYQFLSKYMGDGRAIDFDSIAINLALFQSTSNANTLGVGTGVYGDLTNEVAAANGYTTGGFALTAPTWIRSGSLFTLSATSPLSLGTPTGAGIVARFAVLYFNATISTIVKPLIAVSLLDTTPADFTWPAGNPAEIRWNASGILTLTDASVD